MGLSWEEFARQIRRNYWDYDVPDWADHTPSMTHRREKSMMYHLIKDFPNDIKRIVDAGAFAGASTLSFAMGLKDSGRPTASNMIVSYDLFETDRFSKSVFSQFGIDIQIGQSFLPIFLDVIKDHHDLVSVVKGSILDFSWTGGDIEILFLDVMKSQMLNDHCVRSFFPKLIPGKSLVLQQDFIHDPLPWIPLTMQAMSDHFEILGWCKNTAIFRCLKSITPDYVDIVLANLRSATIEEKLDLFDSVLSHFPEGAPNINLSLSRIWMMHHHGDGERARAELRGFPIHEDWVQVEVARLSAALDRSSLA